MDLFTKEKVSVKSFSFELFKMKAKGLLDKIFAGNKFIIILIINFVILSKSKMKIKTMNSNNNMNYSFIL